LRLHNLLCDELKNINPLWEDEQLYQEAKKILTGMYQHVTYNEFLPILVGMLTIIYYYVNYAIIIIF